MFKNLDDPTPRIFTTNSIEAPLATDDAQVSPQDIKLEGAHSTLEYMAHVKPFFHVGFASCTFVTLALPTIVDLFVRQHFYIKLNGGVQKILPRQVGQSSQIKGHG